MGSHPDLYFAKEFVELGGGGRLELITTTGKDKIASKSGSKCSYVWVSFMRTLL